MTTPGHHNDVVLVGDIRDVYTDGNGAVIGVILMVNADEPCEVPVMFPGARTGVGGRPLVGLRPLGVRADAESPRDAPFCTGTVD